MRAELVDFMGTDLSVVNAARVSFDKVSDWEEVEVTLGDLGCGDEARRMDVSHTEKRLSPADTKLINYLARGCSDDEWWSLVQDIIEGCYPPENGAAVKTLTNMATHWTPFTHTAITLRMQAPVPIRTQCFKHKQGFTENEESRRYISSTPELFVPDHFREASKDKKQGSGGRHPRGAYWVDAYDYITGRCLAIYEEMIEDGVCPELARFVLPQGVEVQWIWTGNLASYARFYNQRTDSHAQKEIQDLAKMVGEIIEPLFPVSWKALTS